MLNVPIVTTYILGIIKPIELTFQEVSYHRLEQNVIISFFFFSGSSTRNIQVRKYL